MQTFNEQHIPLMPGVEHPRYNYKEYIVDIRSIELRFDTVYSMPDGYKLFYEGEFVGEVSNKFMSDKTKSKMNSFAELDLNNGRHRP